MTRLTTILRRYTNLPAAIALLRERRITLLDPESWDDRNDASFLSIYKERRHLTRLAALCFTQASETYYHWRVFSPGESGVCICFKREPLLGALAGIDGLSHRSVEYRTIGSMRGTGPAVSELPFIKRIGFQAEDEFRLIYEESDPDRTESASFPVPLKAIDRVVLSPWIPKPLNKHVKDTLRGVRGCAKLNVVRSTLVSNDQWIGFGQDAS